MQVASSDIKDKGLHLPFSGCATKMLAHTDKNIHTRRTSFSLRCPLFPPLFSQVSLSLPPFKIMIQHKSTKEIKWRDESTCRASLEIPLLASLLSYRHRLLPLSPCSSLLSLTLSLFSPLLPLHGPLSHNSFPTLVLPAGVMAERRYISRKCGDMWPVRVVYSTACLLVRACL